MADLRLGPKKFLQPWFFLGAFRAADMGAGHIDQVLAAKGGHLDMSV